MQELINEIRKLIEYAGPNGEISKKSIDELTIKNLESIIFDLTDNLGKKQTNEAIKVYRNLILEKEPIQRILITLYSHFKKLYFVKLAIESNYDIKEALKLKPNQMFLVNKYKTQSNYFNTEELKSILQSLIDLDNQYKIGKIDLELGLETIICAI